MTYCDNSHHTKLANGGTVGIWMGIADGHPVSIHCVLNTKTCKFRLIKDMAFLGKSYGEWNKVEKQALAPMSYEG